MDLSRLVTPEQLEECRRLQSALAEQGVTKTLSELLVQKGYLSPSHLEKTLQLHDTPVTKRPTRMKEPEAPPEALHAERFGKYARVKRLGAGGMGEVWKAWDGELRRWVALKFLKYDDPEELARFQREAQTAAGLNHPNIAGVHEVGEQGGKHFIAMQFVDGHTLDAFPRDDRRALVALVRDAAAAVHAAHEAGVIHRDLKPANIMVEARTRRVYVMDFGLAKQTSVESSISVSGTIVGTPAYMPPEQARGRIREVDARSDVYSLGVSLYQLLAGRLPFEHPNAYEVLKKVVEEEAPPMRIGGELETIVAKCMDKDPARRYASARELADELTRYLEGEPILAHPPSVFYRLRKRVAKHRALAVAAAAVLTLGAGFGIYVFWSVRQARAKYELAERETDPTRKLGLYREAARHVPEAAAKAEEVERQLAEQVRSTDAKRRHAELFQKALSVWDRAARVSREGFSEDVKKSAAQARALFESANAEAEMGAAHHLIGRCLEIEGDRKGAEAAFERAIALDPELVAARIDLAKSLLLRAILKRGRPELTPKSGSIDIGALPPETDAVRELRERAERVLGGACGEDRDLVDGLLLVARGEHGAAAAHMQTYVERERWDAEMVRLYGFCCLLAKDFAAAEKAFGLALVYEKNVLGHVLRGIARQGRSDRKGAIADYTEVLKLDPKSEGVLCYRAGLHRELRDWAKAEADLTRLIEDFGKPEFHAERGDVRMKLKNWKGALEDYDRVTRETPETHFHRAQAWRSLGRADQARADLDRAIEMDATFYEAWVERATVRYAERDVRGAIDDLTRATEADPKRNTAWYNRAYLRQESGEFEAALEDVTRAIAAKADYPEALHLRSRIHLGLKKYDLAVADATAVIRLWDKSPEPFMSRALAYEALNDSARAKADWQKALELAPKDWPGLREIQEHLERLK